tara:strand:- start:3768 stop:4133 length:366 start_codon:yes stop_codon:yes gene_type:complete
MRDMKIKNLFFMILTILVSALFADASTTDMRGNSRPSEPRTGKSIMEHYRGSHAERSISNQRRAYAPSARKNARTFSNGTYTPPSHNRRSINLGDILDIVIEPRYRTTPTTPTSPKKIIRL